MRDSKLFPRMEAVCSGAVTGRRMLTALVAQGLVQIDRISQDGVRVRASAGKSSFRRRETLQRLHRQVKGHVERLKRQREDEDDSRSAGARAAQERAARERVERVEKALQLLPELEAIKTHQTGKPSKHRPSDAYATVTSETPAPLSMSHQLKQSRERPFLLDPHDD